AFLIIRAHVADITISPARAHALRITGQASIAGPADVIGVTTGAIGTDTQGIARQAFHPARAHGARRTVPISAAAHAAKGRTASPGTEALSGSAARTRGTSTRAGTETLNG